MPTKRRLGRTELEVTSIGLGCWQFSEGTGLAGRFWPALPQTTVNEIIATSLAGGVNWFDTAEAYGEGRSERSLSKALRAAGRAPGQLVVATKWFPVLRTASSIEATIGDRIAALSPWPIDLHQVHAPFGLSSIEAEMEAMAALVAEKKIRAVGVSNFGEKRMRRACAALAAKGLALASNQMKYSLLDRRIERNGVLAAAKELGITIIAYSPLEQGLLTGKFHDDPSSISGPRKVLPAFRRAASRRAGRSSRSWVASLAHGVTPSQAALAWFIQFQRRQRGRQSRGATKVKHAEENVGAMGLQLSAKELDRARPPVADVVSE